MTKMPGPHYLVVAPRFFVLTIGWNGIRCGLVSTEVSRVVHAEDVQTRRVHVAGRENHFVCGVSAVQDLVAHQFTLGRLPRSAFCKYPEERLGDGVKFPINYVGPHRWYVPQTKGLYELWTSRGEFWNIYHATAVHGLRFLAGITLVTI